METGAYVNPNLDKEFTVSISSQQSETYQETLEMKPISYLNSTEVIEHSSRGMGDYADKVERTPAAYKKFGSYP